MRRNQFTVSAESVQGNAGATIVFRSLKVREIREYRESDMTDADLLEKHVLSWTGIVDDAGAELPIPPDEPGILGELYVHEQTVIARLLFQGPDGPEAKN